MDVFGITYIIDNAQQFWSELDEILHLPDDANLQQLDATLLRFVHFCATYHEQYLQTPVQLEHACTLLLQSELFEFHSERMRELLLKDAERSTDPHAQLILYNVLLLYGRNHPSFLRSQKKWQPILMPLIDHVALDFDPDVEEGYTGSVSSAGWSKTMVVPIEARLRLLAVGILYEVCRVQKLSMQELKIFDDKFLDHLFDLVEQTSHLQDESLNYSVIKLIVALNEQFMVASLHHGPAPANKSLLQPRKSAEQSNRVLSVLMRRLHSSKTFGENMIFMLNRAGNTPEDLCMQLLVLKLLYLLFTTDGTSEYFYTNDLCVLVDVFVRVLVDLDDENESLRHTFLRVLHPLLTKTQLQHIPYKRAQILHTLESLIGNSSIRDIDPTTKRLVHRCLAGEWCVSLRKSSSSSESTATTPTAMSRVASPGADSITSSTNPPESPPHKQLARQRSLKSSRSVENLKSAQASSSSSSPHHSSSHSSSKNRLVINALDRAHNNSTISLVSVAASTHNHHPPMPSPTHLHSHMHNGKPRHPASSEMKISTSSSLPASTSSLDLLANGEPLARLSSLGQIVDVLVSPPSSATTAKPSRRSAPPVPPKRRKPPAVPAIKAPSNSTMTTIASSKHRTSPLSRYDQ
ncbi:hypothetical protein SCHPADRAFT_844224 [Schizopora paradoxa]|uniref:SPIN90/Ldb17 leucine-rich domain-containing protein n=1 Tax=Schizopora paradoxa TaxID=27342 RepID=A0A0H2SB50_9AGAM|nr:hypothetical protein SCHPADRAFT_844224 [Schizopora paradoxa]